MYSYYKVKYNIIYILNFMNKIVEENENKISFNDKNLIFNNIYYSIIVIYVNIII